MNKISKNIEATNKALAGAFGDSFDIVRREITDFRGTKMTVVFSDGLVDKELISDNIIRPLLGYGLMKRDRDKRAGTAERIRESIISAVDVKDEADMDNAIHGVLSGDTAVFADGEETCFIAQTRKWQFRGISEPDTQQTVRGPKEGFTETLLFNAAMLRRKIKNRRLVMEMMRVGSVTKTDVCLAYIKGAVSDELLFEVRRRISGIKTKGILESADIEQQAGDSRFFATAAANEKPDVVAAKLMKGRVAVIVDGSPFVLTVPMLFAENFQSAEDYYIQPVFANILRALRYFAYGLTLLLPALYVALLTYHKELIPPPLLNVLQAAVSSVPIPIFWEMAMMLVLYEMLKEAVVRLPRQVGSTVSIVGVLIIGEAAVGVNMIGAPSVVIAAASYIASALTGAAHDSTSVLRFIFLALAGLFGLYGVATGFAALVLRLCSEESFGFPYMMPIAPFKRGDIKKLIWREGGHR